MVTLLFAAMMTASHCTAGTEFEPPLCPTRLPAIHSVTVERTGLKAYEEKPYRLNCSSFRPTTTQVRRFLTNAKTTDAQSADATLDRSPCRASGRVRFANGQTARWEIEQLRVGTLSRPGKPDMLLYCARCAGPFID